MRGANGAGMPPEVEAILREFLGRLRARALRLGVEMPDIDDIVQDALVRACEHPPPSLEPRRIRRWLLRLVRWCGGTYQRAALRSLEDAHEDPEELGALEDDTESLLAERDLILRAIEALRREYREVVRLHDLEGLTIQQVARARSINEHTAQSWLHRGREALRRELYERDPDKRRRALPFGLLGLPALDRSILGAVLDVAPRERTRAGSPQPRHMAHATAAALVVVCLVASDSRASPESTAVVPIRAEPVLAVAPLQPAAEASAQLPDRAASGPAPRRKTAPPEREELSAWRAHAAMRHGLPGRARVILGTDADAGEHATTQDTQDTLRDAAGGASR